MNKKDFQPCGANSCGHGESPFLFVRWDKRNNKSSKIFHGIASTKLFAMLIYILETII